AFPFLINPYSDKWSAPSYPTPDASTKRPKFDGELLLHFHRLPVEQRRPVSPLANGVDRRGNQDRRPVNCFYALNRPVLANGSAQVHVAPHPLRGLSRISGSDFRNSRSEEHTSELQS